jgi:hypothetical protein
MKRAGLRKSQGFPLRKSGVFYAGRACPLRCDLPFLSNGAARCGHFAYWRTFCMEKRLQRVSMGSILPQKAKKLAFESVCFLRSIHL